MLKSFVIDLRLDPWPCGLMDKALVFGTKDCRLESCQGHFDHGRGRRACRRREPQTQTQKHME